MLNTKTEAKEKLSLEDLTPGFISPEMVAAGWDVKEGEAVADLGCGGGYFTIPVARLVKEKGKVFAIDVMEGPIEAVRSKAYLENLGNVEVIRANIEKKGALSKWIKSGVCQHVILANTLYTTKKKKAILDEARRVLENKGQLIVIDWVKNVSGAFRNFGPPIELRFSEKEAQNIVTKAGFSFVRTFDAGQFHFGMIFRKK